MDRRLHGISAAGPPMTWWLGLVIGWLLLSIPAVVVAGRAIRVGQHKDGSRGGRGRRRGALVPVPRAPENDDKLG
jgi:hypothetical protein